MPETNGAPTISEMARRLNYLEGRLDARTVSSDVWAAEKSGLNIELRGQEHRIEALERSLAGAVKLIMGAFLGLIVQTIFLVAVFISHKGSP